MSVKIGTSGWSYEHWKENFYPEGLSTKKWLNYYGEHFPTVEINSTFYHSPLKSSVQNWYAQVPKDFEFSIKASRYITHRKRLNDCNESVEFLYKSVNELKAKMGPILFQLAPTFKANLERLNEFIKYLDDKHRHVFEFRHETWYTQEIYDLLSRNNIGLCISDLKGKLSPEVITADFTYVRLHGPQNAYQGSYGKVKLKAWQKRIEQWNKSVAVYCYFDNDEKGYAIQDAALLNKMLGLEVNE